MWSSPLFWIVFAVALFWALGAYNRLMRLRSAVVQSFGGFDAHMLRLLALLGEFNATAPAHPETAALQGAATQLGASLAVARARPLQPDAVAALAAARGVLQLSWAGAARPLPDDAPTPWQARWDEYALQNEQAVCVFNDAVAQYNAAIAQFPANLLAWTFGFKAARGL